MEQPVPPGSFMPLNRILSLNPRDGAHGRKLKTANTQSNPKIAYLYEGKTLSPCRPAAHERRLPAHTLRFRITMYPQTGGLEENAPY